MCAPVSAPLLRDPPLWRDEAGRAGRTSDDAGFRFFLFSLVQISFFFFRSVGGFLPAFSPFSFACSRFCVAALSPLSFQLRASRRQLLFNARLTLSIVVPFCEGTSAFLFPFFSLSFLFLHLFLFPPFFSPREKTFLSVPPSISLASTRQRVQSRLSLRKFSRLEKRRASPFQCLL
ncbi:hypothetical protein NCLIV_026700 [Neospora caninum Liverpool]|uniref:Transmembrane protein n=1 Tax=Neospora caninum (strain Liverpool) TaxID=572307 RepID=F0VGN7_NEOCL|nr:hypothetical protein NCLIV_026700 [Neospora caninum Liverpool]CBZ52881.1 hypothetical protein NCLIV_026700 [Neospora caninum Liverpool]CEL66863.1 TPA: hypothetical protein BN1204_026700 [Neospora caninum Liverpool]|eukprot:XP_003882913.1 hypothetical protein NCLIV_026700 [Neospora caninum Liverpool]